MKGYLACVAAFFGGLVLAYFLYQWTDLPAGVFGVMLAPLFMVIVRTPVQYACYKLLPENWYRVLTKKIDTSALGEIEPDDYEYIPKQK